MGAPTPADESPSESASASPKPQSSTKSAVAITAVGAIGCAAAVGLAGGLTYFFVGRKTRLRRKQLASGPIPLQGQPPSPSDAKKPATQDTVSTKSGRSGRTESRSDGDDDRKPRNPFALGVVDDDEIRKIPRLDAEPMSPPPAYRSGNASASSSPVTPKAPRDRDL